MQNVNIVAGGKKMALQLTFIWEKKLTSEVEGRKLNISDAGKFEEIVRMPIDADRRYKVMGPRIDRLMDGLTDGRKDGRMSA